MAKDTRKRSLIKVYLSPAEMTKFLHEYSNSIYRSMSEYGRKLLTHKPVKIFYRNKSFDDFIDEAVELRNELRKIREDLNLSHEEENKITEIVKEIQSAIDKLVDQCLPKYM